MVQMEQQLQELDLILPPPPKPAANYKPCQRIGDLLYLSGHIPFENDGKSLITGKIGKDGLSVEQGSRAARQVGLNLLATIQKECNGLDNVQQVVKLFGIVHCQDDFYEQHLVMNGCSDLFVQVFGPEIGCHARSAIGANALPLCVSVEVEAIVRVKTNSS
jgi:enamine deaminase RidA (YjgF/YER057c/UK114 family)